jgi:hypothetical protein
MASTLALLSGGDDINLFRLVLPSSLCPSSNVPLDDPNTDFTAEKSAYRGNDFVHVDVELELTLKSGIPLARIDCDLGRLPFSSETRSPFLRC